MRAIINISILCLLALGAFAQSTNTYEYDNLNRLTKVTYANGAVVQYSYDNVGNRLTKNVAGVYVNHTITVTANPAEGGTVTGGGTYLGGTTCTLTATANEGYTFVNWTKNGSQVSTSPSYTFTVTADASYMANFEAVGVEYAITAEANPAEGGTVTGGGTYLGGTTCTLTATANTGYTFINWTENGEQVSTENPYSFTVTGDRALVANFTLSGLPVPTDGLIAYYPFDGNADDYSGNGNHGTIIGNVVSAPDRFGNPNSAYRFPGEAFNYISVPDADILHLDAFTLSAWVYTDAEDYGGGYLINKGRDIYNGSYRLYVRGIGATTQYGGTNDVSVEENPTVGQWHLITGTVEGDQARFYIDGVLQDEKTLSGTFSCNNTEPLTLGAHYYSGVPSVWAYTLNGVMDEVRIYNRVLTQQEVWSLYGFDAEEGLVAYYPFDGDADDYSGNGYHATPYNSYQYEGGVIGDCIAVEGAGYTGSNGGHVMLPELDFGNSSGVTLNLWVKSLGLSHNDGEAYINFGLDSETDRLFIFQQPDQIKFAYHEAEISIPNESSYADNWVMFSLTCDESGLLKAYVNGTFMGEESVTFDGINTSLAALGRHWWSSTTYTRFIGSFDEVRIYNRALTQQELQLLYGSVQMRYEITATANPDEGGTVSGSGEYDYGTECTLTATSAEGYSFMNWTENGQTVSTENPYSFTVTGERTLVANFVEGEVCAITFDLYDSYGDGWNGNKLVVTEDTGRSFELTLDGGSSGTQTLMLVDGSHVTLTWINGSWTNECSFTVSYSNGNVIYHGSGLNADFSYGFDVDCEGMPVSSFAITATANPEEGGTVSGAGEYDYGTECTLTATLAEGYSFMNWTENGQTVSSENPYSFTVTGNRALVANFTLPLAITATANPEEGGTVSGGGTFEFGETCTLTATANEGYTFINWTENGQTVSTENSYSFTVTGDRALVANFVEEGDLCAITFDLYDSYGDGWNGNKLVVTEDTGWSFELTLDGGSSGTQTLMLVDGSHVTLTWINGSWTNECSFTVSYSNGNVIYHGSGLNADFSYGFDVDCEGMPALSFDIMASANPVEGGTVSGAGTYNYGSTCTLTATANEGYTFVNWTKNGTAVSTNPTYNFTVTESASYVANFDGSATTQTTSFIEGWNWWSSYIELTGIDGLGQLESSLGGAGLMVKSRSDGYVEPYEYNGTTNWYGTLTGIVNEQMYKVRTNTVCNALITGTVVVAAEHPINIGEGWNWIGFPSSQNVSLSLAMSGFTPEANDVIKGRYSYSTYFSDGGTSMWYGTLNSLEPGQGYMYYSNSEGTKTLTFNVERGETIVDNIVSEDNIYRPSAERFSDNMTVTAVVQFGGQELRNDGYEVAAFVGEECRGSVTLMYVEPIDRYVAFLSIFGEASECISFKLTDGSVTYLSDTQLFFAPDGVVGNLSVPFVLDFGIQSVGGDDSVPLRVYPNPSKDVFHVESADIRRVDVFNSLGQVILSKEVSDESVSFDLKGYAPGSYQLRVVTGRGVQNCRIIKE